MLSVAVGRRSREDGDDDLRPESPDDVHDVLEDRIARPEPERFLGGFGKPEVVCPGEELPRAIQLTRREQLFGTNDPQRGTELGPDQVLTPFAAREREIGGLRAPAARQQHEQLRVLVVGVRTDHQDALVAAELAQGARQCRDAAGAGRRQLRHAGARGADTKEEGESESSHY